MKLNSLFVRLQLSIPRGRSIQSPELNMSFSMFLVSLVNSVSTGNSPNLFEMSWAGYSQIGSMSGGLTESTKARELKSDKQWGAPIRRSSAEFTQLLPLNFFRRSFYLVWLMWVDRPKHLDAQVPEILARERSNPVILAGLFQRKNDRSI
jgi:hypothetical protein